MNVSAQPNVPTPDAIMALTNKHVGQTIDVINAQMTEASTALGAPALPVLPKFAPPALPKMGQGQLPGLPQMPFTMPFAAATTTKKGEETIVKTEVPTPSKAMVIA